MRKHEREYAAIVAMSLAAIVVMGFLVATLAGAETYRDEFDRWSRQEEVAYARGVQDALETAAVWTQMRRGHWEVIETYLRPLNKTPEELADDLFASYEPTMTGRIMKELKDE